MELPSDDPGRQAPDPLMPVRGTLGVLLVVIGGFVMAWVLLLVYGFLEGTWSPAAEQRLMQVADQVSGGAGPEAGAAALVAVPVVILLALAIMGSIGGRMIVGGASLLQPDWRTTLRRIEHALIALRAKS